LTDNNGLSIEIHKIHTTFSLCNHFEEESVWLRGEEILMVLNLLDKNTILFYNEADKFKDRCGRRGVMYLWGKKILEKKV